MAIRRTTTPRPRNTRRTHRVRNFFRTLATALIIGLAILAAGLIVFALTAIAARGVHHGWFGAGGNPSGAPTPIVVNCPDGANVPARECFGGRREHRQRKPTPATRTIRKPVVVRQPTPALDKPAGNYLKIEAGGQAAIIIAKRLAIEPAEPCCSPEPVVPPTPPPTVREYRPSPPPMPAPAPQPKRRPCKPCNGGR